MKSYTPSVIGGKPPRRGFWARLAGKVPNMYYEGRDTKENIYALWIESERAGNLRCFPCVLDEAGDYLVYETIRAPETARENAMLIQRWPLFLSQETKENFAIRELDQDTFNKIYQKYRNDKLRREYEKAGLEVPDDIDSVPVTLEKDQPEEDPQAEAQES